MRRVVAALAAMFGLSRCAKVHCGTDHCETSRDDGVDDVLLLQTDILLSKTDGSSPLAGSLLPAHGLAPLAPEKEVMATRQHSASNNSIDPHPAVVQMEAALEAFSTMLQPGEVVARRMAFVQTSSHEPMLGTFFIVLAFVIAVGLLYLICSGQLATMMWGEEGPKVQRPLPSLQQQQPGSDNREWAGFRQPSQQSRYGCFEASPGEKLLKGDPKMAQSSSSTPSRPTTKRICGPAFVPSSMPPTSGDASHGQAVFAEVSPDPPPICPSLILPNAEAKFVISASQILHCVGEFDILGTSGRKLLHTTVKIPATGERSVALSSASSTSDPRCMVVSPAGGGQEMQVYGRDARHYGMLQGNPNNGGTLTFSGPPLDGAAVLAFDIGDIANLEMFANTLDGRRLGWAAKRDDEDVWRLQVNAGADAVLICSCMLALLLLRDEPAIRSSSSTQG